MTADGARELDIPPLFAHLVDETGLLRSGVGATRAQAVSAVVDRYLRARGGHFGGLVGQLLCPVSRLPQLVGDLAKRGPDRPVEISLVVDTGLGAVPKALSTVLSRANLVTPVSVETAAPPDVDAVWLERVSEFVPDDVTAVVEPRRPQAGDEPGTSAWLTAVRRVAEHGCTPKLRVGGPRRSDVPTTADVERFVHVAVAAGRGFTALGVRETVRAATADGTPAGHGLLNLIVAVARAVAGGDVRAALESTDAAALADEIGALPTAAAARVRGLLVHCGAEPVPGDGLVGLGLLDAG